MSCATPLARSHALVILPSRSTQEHWRYGGHKKACKAYVLAATVQAQQEREGRMTRA